MFILKTRNVVPALLLAGVSGRYVVPELLRQQQLQGRRCGREEPPSSNVVPELLLHSPSGRAVFPELARRRAGPRQTVTSIAAWL
jgi:hypothetical protein